MKLIIPQILLQYFYSKVVATTGANRFYSELLDLNFTLMLYSGHFNPERIFFFLKMLVYVIALDQNVPTLLRQDITTSQKHIFFYIYLGFFSHLTFVVLPFKTDHPTKKWACKSLIMLYYHQILYSMCLSTCFLWFSTGFAFLFGSDWL